MFEDWNTLQRRTEDWLLLESPVKITLLCSAYLIFVLYAGPKFMKNRPAYSLKKVIIGYNIFQIIVSYYLAKEALTNGISFTDLYKCRAADYSGSTENMYRLNLAYYSFMLKIVELIETVFFVLRKKQNQISTLHIYHHITTLYIAYFGAKYVGCGFGCICLILNLIVHFFMYSYYLLSSFGDENWQRKLMFYKMALTKLQIVQFLIMLTFAAIMCTTPHCLDPINKVGISLVLPDVFFLLYMFVKFYINAYIKNPNAATINNATNKVN